MLALGIDWGLLSAVDPYTLGAPASRPTGCVLDGGIIQIIDVSYEAVVAVS